MKTDKIKLNSCLTYAAVLLNVALLTPAYAVEPVADKNADKKAPVAKTPEVPENPILSIAAADLNSDKRIDSAVLLKSGDQADLYVYVSNASGEMELKLTKKNIVWSGALAGTLPHLKTEKGGVLLIYAENDAIGRSRWHQHLSVDYRDNDFIVTGYTYDANDTVDPKAILNCDVNLLTGKGVKNKTPFKIDKQKIKLSDWSDASIPKQCRN